MKKLWYKSAEWLPIVWGLLWCGIITIGSAAVLIAVIKWLLILMGVM